MNGAQQFRYPTAAIWKDYAQAGVGAAIFGTPLIFAGGNVYVAAVLGAIVLMFLAFGVSTWRRRRSVIVVTDDAIGVEGGREARISWPDIERVELRYFSTRRQRGRDGGGEWGNGWMQLKLEGGGATIRIDSALEGFDSVARRVAEATERFDIPASPTTKTNFAALGLAPNASWNEGG